MTDESNLQSHLRPALITFVLMAVLFAVFAGWYHRTHPPYKWPVIPPPDTMMPVPNAFDIYNDAYAMQKDPDVAGNGYLNPTVPSLGLPTHTQSELDKAAADNLPLLAKVREGLRYQYKAPSVRSFAAGIGYYAHDREIARVMLFEGLIDEQRHRWDDALQVEVDTMRFGSALMHSEGLIGPLVSIACEAIGRAYTWNLVDKVSASTAKLEAQRLQSIDASLPSAADLLKSDEISTEASLMDEFHNPRWRDEYVDQAINDSDSSSSSTSGASAFIRHQMIRAEINSISPEIVIKDYTTYTDALIGRTALPYSAYILAPMPKSPTDAIGKMFVVMGGDYVRPHRESDCALNELLATMLALHAYQAERERYPAKLADLVPGYLMRVPIDPYADGRPMTYKLTGNSYLLYSVGPDGKDDGGKPIFDPSRTGKARYRVYDDSKGDIVAGLNH